MGWSGKAIHVGPKKLPNTMKMETADGRIFEKSEATQKQQSGINSEEPEICILIKPHSPRRHRVFNQ